MIPCSQKENDLQTQNRSGSGRRILFGGNPAAGVVAKGYLIYRHDANPDLQSGNSQIAQEGKKVVEADPWSLQPATLETSNYGVYF